MFSYLGRISTALSLSVVVALVCHGQGNGNPRLNLTIGPSERSVAAGGSTSFDVGVKGVGNFNGVVTFATAGAPAGVAVTFSPSTLTLKNGHQSDSNALVTVAANVAPGRYPINFLVNGGSVSDSAIAVLVVSSSATGGGFDFSVSPVERTVTRGGQTDFNLSLSMAGIGGTAVNLSLKSGPAGISAMFAPSSTVVVTGGSINVATANVKVDSSVQPGNYQLVFAADSSTVHRERTVILHVVGIDASTFDLDVSPGSRTLFPSTTLPFTLTLVSRNGFQGMVNLSADGLPLGATVAFQSGSSIALTPGSTAVVTALISTGPAILAGTFPVRFSADSGTIHRERVVLLGPSARPDFEVDVVPSVASVAPGDAVKFTLLLAPNPGFSGPVKLGVRQLPTGAVATFDPSDIVQLSSGPASVVSLVVQTAAGTPVGDYPFIITADSGGTSQLKTPTLKVVRFEDFTLSATPVSRTVSPGGSASYELTLTSVSQFSGAIDLSAGNLPLGVTAFFTPDNTVVLVAGGSVKLIATLATNGATPTGSYVVEFKAKSGTIERSAMVRLGVEGSTLFNFTASPLLRIAQPGSNTLFPLTLSSQNNFTGPVNITAGVVPAGVTVTLAPAPPVNLQAGQSIAIQAQVYIAPSVPAGKYPIRFAASSANASSEALVLLWVTNEQGYYFDAIPDFRDVAPGNSASYILRLTSIGTFSGPVQLSAQGLPPGSSAVFPTGTQINLSPGQTQTAGVTISTTEMTPLGPANLKFNADATGLHKEDTVTLNVVPFSGFRLELAPSSRTAAPDGSATYVLTLWSIGGFAGPVNLNVNDLPDGFTASLDPGNPVQLEAGGVEVVQLVVQIPANAGSAIHRFQVQAVAEGLEASETARLVVSAENTVRLSIRPTERTVARGETTIFAVRVTSDAYQGPVVLSTVGLPAGAATFSLAGQLLIRPGESIDFELSVRPGASASLGLYNFAVLADTSAPGTAEALGKLTVVGDQDRADFSMVIVPASRTVNSGATAVYKVFLTSLNGFRGSVDLSVLGFPPGDAKWDEDNSIFLQEGETRSATLLIKTEKGAEEKLYRLLFAADADNVHHEATGSMTVVKTPSDDDDDDEQG